MDILDYEKEEIIIDTLKEKIEIEKASKTLFKNNKTITKEELKQKLKQYKKKYDYILVNNSPECFFELNKTILEEADKIIFVIEKNIKDIRISNNLLKIYETNWKIETKKIDIVLNNIRNTRKIDIIPYERKTTEKKEITLNNYKNLIKI